MIVNAWGVVLSRRDLGEADRLSVIYTENLGKIPVRFVGVNKPGRKLKALSEPMTWAEYRLYISPRSEFGKCVGGQLISTFPGIREDLPKTVEALTCCELMKELTADRSPNPEKYRLLCSALALLEEGGSPWLPVAFGLQLMSLAGFGVEEAAVPEDGRELWDSLHATALDALSVVPWRPEAAERFRRLLDARVEAQLLRPLRTRAFAAGVFSRVEAAC
jgi:DNA repair protein RecO (recombination protein O)